MVVLGLSSGSSASYKAESRMLAACFICGFKIRSDDDFERALVHGCACCFCDWLRYCPDCGHRECGLGYALRRVPCKRFKRNVCFHGHLPWELVGTNTTT